VGNLAKLPVAHRFFGKQRVDDAMARIADVLGRWGYRVGCDVGERDRLRRARGHSMPHHT